MYGGVGCRFSLLFFVFVFVCLAKDYPGISCPVRKLMFFVLKMNCYCPVHNLLACAYDGF